MQATASLPRTSTVTIDGREITVRRTRILSTEIHVYSAWEPLAGHSTSMRFDEDGERFGRLSSAPLPYEIGSLPYGDERSDACAVEFTRRGNLARTACYRAYPHLQALATFEGGDEVSTDGEER